MDIICTHTHTHTHAHTHTCPHTHTHIPPPPPPHTHTYTHTHTHTHTTATSLVFGVSLIDLVTQEGREGREVPRLVSKVVEHIEKEGTLCTCITSGEGRGGGGWRGGGGGGGGGDWITLEMVWKEFLVGTNNSFFIHRPYRAIVPYIALLLHEETMRPVWTLRYRGMQECTAVELTKLLV